ncbi:glycoside hydrolase family 43 protein [Periconia macrospinosa]|uniref:Glycoside hydrolase family 43 protein n=1 Tax=Periconia macrospinosa TaxID=97972 RepID=A0A2V1DC64_9PLEO|nr:glycoside hydrolase family 43 protein [Periconia macrospinosa]
MGVRSDSPPTSDEELSDFGDLEPGLPHPDKPSNSTASTLKKFCLPDRWLAAVGFGLTVALILAVSLGTTVHHPKKLPRPKTGHYPSDAPFREVIHSNFPDPALLHHNGTWFVYASNNAAGIIHSNLHGQQKDLGVANVQLATSKNFLDWEIQEPAKSPLQELPKWVSSEMMASVDTSIAVPRADLWAPDILRRPDGKFVLYYSATPADEHSIHCIGASVGNSPKGPFEAESEPIACHPEEGGTIDTNPFLDHNDTVYILYKIDGNNRGNGGECLNTVPPLKNTPIYLHKMEKDGTTTSGEPIKILDRTDSDGPLVEAPSLIRTDEGIYILFFSTGCTFDPSYTLKYATSTNITGPYTRAKETLLKTGTHGLYAPGSASIVRDGSKWRMAFHARVFNDDLGGGIRPMYVADLEIRDTEVSLVAPE